MYACKVIAVHLRYHALPALARGLKRQVWQVRACFASTSLTGLLTCNLAFILCRCVPPFADYQCHVGAAAAVSSFLAHSSLCYGQIGGDTGFWVLFRRETPVSSRPAFVFDAHACDDCCHEHGLYVNVVLRIGLKSVCLLQPREVVESEKGVQAVHHRFASQFLCLLCVCAFCPFPSSAFSPSWAFLAQA